MEDVQRRVSQGCPTHVHLLFGLGYWRTHLFGLIVHAILGQFAGRGLEVTKVPLLIEYDVCMARLRQKSTSSSRRTSKRRSRENSVSDIQQCCQDDYHRLPPEALKLSNRNQAKAIFCLALIAMLTVNAMSIPVPPGFKNPWVLRLSLGFYKFYTALHDIVEYGWDLDARYLFFKSTFAVPPPPPEVWHIDAKVTDRSFDGVPVRIYDPPSTKTKRGGIIFFHGGGWTLGSVKMYDPFCTSLADAVDAVVVSVEFRMAPEFWYPTQLLDCEAAATHFLQHAEEYGVDPERITIMGDSAGGNLAAAVNLKLRDKKITPKPRLQILLYPALQPLDMRTPSYQKNALHPILSQRTMAGFWLLYAQGTINHLDEMITNNHTSSVLKHKLSTSYLSHDNIPHELIPENYVATSLDHGNDTLWSSLEDILTDPYFSPLLAESLDNLPQTFIMTMAHDVLRDDGMLYAQRLRKAGNRVTHTHYESGFHGLVSYPIPLVEDCKIATEKIYSYLRKHL